jgi:hypothetical protein
LGAQTDATHTEQPDAPRRDATRVAALRTDIPSPFVSLARRCVRNCEKAP